MANSSVHLTSKGTHRCLWGHPWVFDNEIQRYEGDYKPGDIVNVIDSRGKLVGSGYINPRSAIRVRLLTMGDQEVDSNFIVSRIEDAFNHRARFFDTKDSFGKLSQGYRLVFSEGDFLPGLIVDIFGGYVSFQILTLGMDKFSPDILKALKELTAPLGIYERNDAPVRKLEGLPLKTGYVGEPFDPIVEIEENGVSMLVDMQKGQKTGYFLDQTTNREIAASYLKGARVLDCFSYSGGFGMAAAANDASSVVSVDVSKPALDLAKASAQRNGFQSKMSFKEANVFDYLREQEKDGQKYDAVILDPPGFARNRRMVPKALAGYKEINHRAMKIIENGGFLMTSSCSQHVTSEEFDGMLDSAARDGKKVLRVMEKRGQRQDHPYLMSVPETEYLKFRIFQVLDQ